MSVLQLVLLALDTVAKVATNPALGLGGDGTKVAGLIGVIANLGRQGEAAVTELQSFTAEIQSLADAGLEVDPARWDEITARRKSQHEALQALADEGKDA